MKNNKPANDVGYRGESYKVYSAKASETDFEASYEFASGNKTAKSRTNINNKK